MIITVVKFTIFACVN